ncbi:MAG: type II toxin-antitoxin system PemK/MazF family toxin [Verrucomicrobiota bacterium]
MRPGLLCLPDVRLPDLRQWDIVRVRIRPTDKDEPPAVLVSNDEICADERYRVLNVVYGRTRRAGQTMRAHEVVLNGADGFERPTVFSCHHLYTVERAKISARLGEVTRERRRQLGRATVATYRLPLA